MNSVTVNLEFVRLPVKFPLFKLKGKTSPQAKNMFFLDDFALWKIEWLIFFSFFNLIFMQDA